MICIEIKRKIQSQNAFSNKRGFGSSLAYKNDRASWLVNLRAALRPKDPPAHLVRVEIVSQRNRLIDFGNLVGGAKAIPDCLKRLGYIRDDSPKWFESTYRQEKVPKANERTIIRIINP